MDKGTMYLGGIVLGIIIGMSILNQWLATFLPPQLVQQIGSGLTLVGMVGGIVLLEASFILRTAGFPFLLMIIRPSNEFVEVFFNRNFSKENTEKVGDNLWSTPFQLKFPRNIKSYGKTKVDQFRILHEFEFDQRFQFNPGRASLDEYDFDHANTEVIEVTQLPGNSTLIDRSKAIPEYKLLAARNDYLRTFTKLRTPITTGAASTTQPVDQDKKIEELEHLLAQKTSEAAYYHQQSVSTEQWVEQQRTETRGLLGAMNSITAYAIEFLLQLIKAFGSVDKALTHLQGNAFDRWGKWVILGIIGGGAIVYLQLNPQVLNGIYTYFNEPTHQIVIVAMLAIAFLGLYLYMKRRRPGT